MADEAVYKSLYTGAQIDEAIAAALDSKKKGPFLPLNGGGTIQEGEILFTSSNAMFQTALDSYGIYFLDKNGGGIYIIYSGEREGIPAIFFGGKSEDQAVELQHIATPIENYDAANKIYVDQMIKPIVRTVTLLASGWVGNEQTVTLSGVLADESKQMITLVPQIASQAAYFDAGIRCTNQGENSLTFACDAIPTVDLTIYVTVEEVRTE